MAEIIQGRVFQKQDTLANWMSNTLILGSGEQAFVTGDDGESISFKIGDGTKVFSDLPWPDFTVRGKAATSTVFSTLPSGIYVPTENGTYNGSTTVTLSDGYQILYWDTVSISKVVFPINLGGYATLTNLNSKLDFSTGRSGFYQANGVYNTSSSWKTMFFQYNGIIDYAIYGTTSTPGTNLLTFLDASYNVLGQVAATGVGVIHSATNYDIPDNAVIVAASTLVSQIANSYVRVNNSADLSKGLSVIITGKADHGYTGSDSIKTLKQVEAEIGTVVFKDTSFPDNGFWTPAGTYNASVNFRSRTVPIKPGDTVSYHTYTTDAGGGSSIVTWLNSSSSRISSVDTGAGGLILRTGSATAPANSAYAVFSTFNANISDSYVTYPTDSGVLIGNAFTQINTKADKPVTKKITVSKTLTADGVTIFNTITSAIAAWTSGVQILVFPGVYDEYSINVPDGCIMTAIGFVWVRGYLPANSTTTDIDAISTMNIKDTATLSGFKITGQNMRYPIHSDFGNPLGVQVYNNCIIEHLGNSEAYNYRVANSIASPNDAASTWKACSAFGCGTQSGARITINDSIIKSTMRAFSTHNNSNYDTLSGYSKVVCNNCDIYSSGVDVNGSVLPFQTPVFVQSLDSNTNDIVELNNCTINGFLALQSSSQDYREFTQRVVGSGNNSHLMQVRHSVGGNKTMTYQTTDQNTFVIKVVSNTNSPVVISGNLTSIMFGTNPIYKNGSNNIKGYVKGNAKHANVWANINSYSGTKSITFTSGADTKTVTISTTLTSASQLVTLMNTAFGAGSFVASLYWTGFDWYPEFTNEIRVVKNTGTADILRGRAVKQSVVNTCALMTSSDTAPDFYGVALEDIPASGFGHVKYSGYMLRIWLDGLFGITLTDNQSINVQSDGTFSTTGGLPVTKCINNENVLIKA